MDISILTAMWLPLAISFLLEYPAVTLCQLNNCEGTQSNYRMSSKKLSTPLVYTALQCQDKCFRTDLCEAFNFKPRELNEKHATCELLQLDGISLPTRENGFFFQTLDRSLITNKWLPTSCNACNSRQRCSRQIDACEADACQCLKGYVDDGSGTCPLIGCTDNALLTPENRHIGMPTTLKNLCAAGETLIREELTCYLVVSLDKAANISLEFSKFSLEGNKAYCSTSYQYMEIIVDDIKNTPSPRVCGDHGINSVQRYAFGKRIYLKFHFGSFSSPCKKLVGSYNVVT